MATRSGDESPPISSWFRQVKFKMIGKFVAGSKYIWVQIARVRAPHPRLLLALHKPDCAYYAPKKLLPVRGHHIRKGRVATDLYLGTPLQP